MPDPLIAIVGSVYPNRQQELHLNDPDRARQAAEELGAELAKRGCRIQVYSSTPTFHQLQRRAGPAGCSCSPSRSASSPAPRS